MKRALEARLAAAKAIAEQLLGSKLYYFADLKPSDLQGGLAVIYAIFDKNTGESLYVGRTKNLRQRLYNNHLMGPRSNARLKKYLVEDESVPDITTMSEAKTYLRDNCCFRYIAEPDVRRRGQIEGLLSYLLDVRYIDEEH
jgi:hypothetical protein